MCVRSGSNSGSLFVDLKFEELIRSMCVPPPYPFVAVELGVADEATLATV